ncbi:Uncharacterised protein [Mycobacteroides abscessus subsp. abscessus]|nr:Uncharacterised protein [Mycobacteroides abscessus subsp. abscessus]SHY08482.1 Uncharacterised protein [Mycobacteroides abscessus subsp. abscessus]SHY71490.1 Uncharacterised protein [Mycobacteroides abscessus subsp. abscessus]SHZ92972.1 Uncharacterised protein [Mycobacteroides abscessus subsp. abscessus]SIC44186.1 Uncharacterised protein [Mycobacteroides abscessus subsp. abscessus]
MGGPIKIGPRSVTRDGKEYPLEPWQMAKVTRVYEELTEDGWPPTEAEMSDFNRFVTLMTRLDDTWRLLDRVIATDVHPTIDGEDCYVFIKKGGDRPTDRWSITYKRVSAFWG